MEDTGIYARESSVLDRYVQLGFAQGRVLSVEFPNHPESDASSAHELLDRIDDYLTGETDDFTDVAVALTLPTDEREVLEKVREIPYGERGTVEQVAAMVPGRSPDEEADLAAVREAIGKNPAPLLIPTHRVRDAPNSLPPDVAETVRELEGL